MAGSVALLVVALAMNFVLTLAVLNRPYEASVLAPLGTMAEALTEQVAALGSGPPADSVGGLLSQWQRMVSARYAAQRFLLGPADPEWEGLEVSWVGPDGAVLASTDRGLHRGNLPPEILAVVGGESAASRSLELRTARDGGHLYVLVPRTGEPGGLVISLSDAAATLHPVGVALTHATTVVFVLAVGAMALLFLLRRYGDDRDDRAAAHHRKRQLSLVATILVCQVVSTAALLFAFHRDTVSGARLHADLLLSDAASRIERSLVDFPQVEDSANNARLLRHVAQSVPSLRRVALSESTGRAVTEVRTEEGGAGEWFMLWAGRLLPVWGGSDGASLEYPIMAGDSVRGILTGELSLGLSLLRVSKSLFDGFAGILVSMLVFLEFTLILSFWNGPLKPTPDTVTHVKYELIRPAAFFYVFGIDLSLSFLPLHMEKLYRPIFGLSRDFVIGLPISVEFLCVGIAILVAGVWFDRRGWREPFLVGIGLAALGGFYSWIARTALHFIVSRALIGIGYGLALMASQGFVIRNTDGGSKAHGLAHLFAGLYAGSICGGAMGGILAERYGYEAVFLLGAVIVALVIPYALTFLRSAGGAPRQQIAPISRGNDPSGRLGRFLCNRGVLALMLFSSLPASVAVVGFLNYFSPLYLHRLGASESTIGQVLVIYGICLIFIGPAMGKRIDASKSKRKIIFAGCLIGSAAFFSFTLAQGILAAVMAVFLLGLSHSLVLSSQSAYILKFQATQDLGEGKALGIFRSSSRLGQMLGPMIFSGLVVSTSMQQGALVLGAVYLIVALLFLVLTSRDHRLLAEQYV